MSERTIWNRAAATYDEAPGHGLHGPREREVWGQLFRRLFPEEPRLRVLDVGTGTGFVAFFAAELGHDVVGMDYSPQMLAVAEAQARERGLDVSFRLGEAAALPDLGEGSFDAVVSRHVIWTLPYPEEAVRAWAHVTKPGGSIVAIDGIWSDTEPVGKVLGTAVAWFDAIRTRSRPRPIKGDPMLPLRHVRDPEPARNVFSRAGLVDVRGEFLPGIDRVERMEMTWQERLRYRWRRYLVEGTVPAMEARP